MKIDDDFDLKDPDQNNDKFKNPDNYSGYDYQKNSNNKGWDTIYQSSYNNSDGSREGYRKRQNWDMQQEDNRYQNERFDTYKTANNERKARTKSPSFSAGIITFLIVAGALLFTGFAIFAISKLGGDKFSGIKNNSEMINPGGPTLKTEDRKDGEYAKNAIEIYEKCSKSTVGVEVTFRGPDFFDEQVGAGSGVIMTSDGFVVTNSHVIQDSKDAFIRIITSDGNVHEKVKVIGYDQATDLAVLKVDGVSNFEPAIFGNSDQLRVGEDLVAIGNPHGVVFSQTMTKGIVSALKRTLSNISRVKFIQTDTPINPGNSGGALFDMAGRVVGLTSTKLSLPSTEGMGFAIPISSAKVIVDDLIKFGYVPNRPSLGIGVKKLIDEPTAHRYNISTGILVGAIYPHSSLHSSSIKIGDVISKINGKQIKTINDVCDEIEKHSVGDKVTLSAYRLPSGKSAQGKEFETEATLVEEKREESETRRSNTE
jgi:serine protease Do